MRRQLLLIGTEGARDTGAHSLPAPQVIAFSGHMIDHPERASPRFPADVEARVAAALRETVAALGPSIGFAQAACGADILFLEAMQDAGMQTQIVLPFPAAEFVRSSVAFAGEHWIARFERALARATRVVLATEEGFLGDDVLFEHAANLIQGMAYLRAMELSAHPLMLTVLERGAAEAIGGTQATARNWVRKGGRIENIDIAAMRGDAPPQYRALGAKAATPRPANLQPRRMLKSLLFADVSGFSRMPEQYAPRFAEMFLGTAKRVLDSLPYQAVHANTHGDGLFLVFDLPSHAAEFAHRLQHEIGAVRLAGAGAGAGNRRARRAAHRPALPHLRPGHRSPHVLRHARQPDGAPRARRAAAQHLRDRGIRGLARRRGPGPLHLRLHRHDAARQEVRRCKAVPAAARERRVTAGANG